MRALLIAVALLFSLSGLCNERSEHLEFDLKVKTTLYQSSLQTQLYLAGVLRPLVVKSIEDGAHISEDIEEFLNQIAHTNDYVKDPKIRIKIKKILTTALHEVRVTARKEGVGLAILLAINETVGNIAPFILSAVGLPQLILPMSLILTSEINLPLTLALKKGFQRVKVIRMYGGRETFKKIKTLRKTLKKDHGLAENSIMSESGDSSYFQISTKFGILDKLKSLVLRNVINPLTLKRTLKKEGLWNEDLAKIKASDVEPSIVSILMITYVLNNFDNGHKVLVQRFPELHFDKKESDLNPLMNSWASDFLSISTKDELIAWSLRVPTNATALEVVLLWKNVFLPHLIENSTEGIRYKNYRHWMKKLSGQVAKAELNPAARWDDSWQLQFQDYLDP